MKSRACGLSFILYPSADILSNSPLSSISMILSISSLVSWLNMMTSSILFRNSGAKVFCRAFCRILLFCSLRVVRFAEVSNPTPAPNSVSWRVPMFEVIITMVLRKSTLRPRLSVSWPSSSTCSRMWNTSGCAFSISSSSTTE